MVLFFSTRSKEAKASTSGALTMFQLLVLATAVSSAAAAAAPPPPPMALPGCPERCGNVTVPYPFGIRPGCFHDGFNLTCDEARHPAKLFAGDGAEVEDISLLDGTVRIRSRMLRISRNSTSAELNGTWDAGVGWRLTVSTSHNRFVAIGCDLLASLFAARVSVGPSGDILGSGSYASVCAALCEDGTQMSDTSCSGVGCCQTPIALGLPSYGVQLRDVASSSGSGYGVAFIAEQEWFSRKGALLQLDYFGDQQNIVDTTEIPVVLEWSLDKTMDMDLFSGWDDQAGSARCTSVNSIIIDDNNGIGRFGGSRCNCSKGYEGNPYIANGCQGWKNGKIGQETGQQPEVGRETGKTYPSVQEVWCRPLEQNYRTVVHCFLHAAHANA